ncbi:unnamed protein product [Mesocestoides corti]|nr:unnamed protein product [Mesocestoides corti]
MEFEAKEELKTKRPELQKISKVTVHPLVLLGVVDHFNRMGKVSGGQRRVVGVLLGALRGTVLDVSNCFAVPFEEDTADPNVWFLDHDYLENMFSMFKKVNARERIVGWYHSGPKLCTNDIKINELFRKYTQNSVLVVVDVKTTESDGIPTEAYIAVEEVHDDGTSTTKTFDHLLSEIGAEEAEEVGVEHLLRDIKDSSLGSLSQRIDAKVSGLGGMLRQLEEIQSYLELVTSKRIPVNHQVMYKLQDMFNLLPDVRMQEMVRCLSMTSNDQMLVIYMACTIRAILALHDLINNKLTNRETERNEEEVKKSSKPTVTGDHPKEDVIEKATEKKP